MSRKVIFHTVIGDIEVGEDDTIEYDNGDSLSKQKEKPSYSVEEVLATIAPAYIIRSEFHTHRVPIEGVYGASIFPENVDHGG